MFFFGAQMIRACEIQTAKSCKGSCPKSRRGFVVGLSVTL